MYKRDRLCKISHWREKMSEPNGTVARDLGHVAYLRIREAIRDGSLGAGTRITELDLTQRLGLSRTPVREAIYKLEAEGLLSHEARRGFVVTKPDHQMIVELYSMREALEGTASRLAAQHASDAEIEALQELIGAEAHALGDAAAMSQINDRIHGLICLSAHNRYLLRGLDTISATVSLLPTLLGDPEHAREAHEQHSAIVDRIRARDPEGAETAARLHIVSAGRRRVGQLVREILVTPPAP
jgi:DNA-binding GntR family transcriptional regulator